MSVNIRSEQPAPTDLEISEIEDVLGIKLNKEFLEFVRRYNGGVPESNIFRISKDNEAEVAKFIALNAIPQDADFIRKSSGKYIIPIAYDTCGNYVCISNERNDGEIYFWNHEFSDLNALTTIAPSLADFLGMLHPFDTGQIALDSSQVKSAWIDPELLKG